MFFLVCSSVLLRVSGVDVNEVSVRVILVDMAIAGLPALVRSGFRAIVHVTDVVKPEFLSFSLSVGVIDYIIYLHIIKSFSIILEI